VSCSRECDHASSTNSSTASPLHDVVWGHAVVEVCCYFKLTFSLFAAGSCSARQPRSSCGAHRCDADKASRHEVAASRHASLATSRRFVHDSICRMICMAQQLHVCLACILSMWSVPWPAMLLMCALAWRTCRKCCPSTCRRWLCTQSSASHHPCR
jgi:hypothetical protein